jgi:hypothetical protein
MGLEIHGNADDNFDLINVWPDEYRDNLEEAIVSANRFGLKASVYNVPLCLCSDKVRQFARKSISGWKNDFPPACDNCSARADCSGFFGTSTHLPLNLITPFKDVV